MPAIESRRGQLLVSVLAVSVGVALAGALMLWSGAARTADLVDRARFAFAGVIALHVTQIVLTGAAWRALVERAPRLLVFVAVRWLREGVNSLLPVLPVAGLFAAIRVLARRGLVLPEAVAATLADSSVEIASQIPFTLLGVTLLVVARGTGAVRGWMAGGIAGLCLLAAVMIPGLRFGLARLAERMARRFGFAGQIDGLHDALARIYRAPRRLSVAAGLHLLAWLLGGGEVWLILRAFGDGVPWWQAVVIEALGQAVRAAAFAVPGALGVQEGGYILVCGLFGVPAAAGLALSLVKRLRDLVIGVPSLALWLRLERGRTGAARGRNPRPCPPHSGINSSLT